MPATANLAFRRHAVWPGVLTNELLLTTTGGQFSPGQYGVPWPANFIAAADRGRILGVQRMLFMSRPATFLATNYSTALQGSRPRLYCSPTATAAAFRADQIHTLTVGSAALDI